MVKGISRQVIVVRPPDTELFEQAIFILRDRAVEGGGVTDEELLRQARQAADGYLRSRARGGRKSRLFSKPALSMLFGALLVAILWALSALLF